MKKITQLLLMFSTLWGYAQVKNYTCEYTTGNTYTDVSGTPNSVQLVNSNTINGANFYDSAAGPQGATNAKGQGLPIGFTFVYDGVAYDRFGVNMNGWIGLGMSSLMPTISTAIDLVTTSTASPLASVKALSAGSPDALYARIAALGLSMTKASGSPTATSITYVTTGSAGSQVLTVQWKKFQKASGDTSGDINFQIRLYEGTNRIEIAYGSITTSATSNTAAVGLRAGFPASDNSISNFYTLQSWTDATKGTSASTVAFSNTAKPSSGVVFAFTPPACSEPKQLVSAITTNNSATFSWGAPVPAPASGYQYKVSSSSVAPLDTDSGKAVTVASATENGLTPNTVYYIFVRSACTSGYSSWVNMGSFKTKCDDKTVFSESFDASTMPDCWDTKLIGAAASATITSNRLVMVGYPVISTFSYVIMPPLSNLGTNTHRLRFKASGKDASTCKLDVGYFDSTDTFVSLLAAPINLTTATTEYFLNSTTSVPSSVKNLVFKNAGTDDNTSPGNDLYIDDVSWEVKPDCADITNITTKRNADNSVQLSWASNGTESAWQYVYADPAVAYPSTETIHNADSKSVNITDLLPSTPYKLWIRSKCNNGGLGNWYPSAAFTTPCASVTALFEDFDNASAVPDCWRLMGTTLNPNGTGGFTPGTYAVTSSTGSYSTKALEISAPSKNTSVYVAFPPINTAATGGYRLRFKYKTTAPNAGTAQMVLVNYVDPLSLNAGSSAAIGATAITIAQKDTWYTFDLAVTAQQTVNLGIRYMAPSGDPSTKLYIDDLEWEPMTNCPDVTAASVKRTTGNTVSFNWTKNSTEAHWQYAVGPTSSTNPNTLQAVDFSSSNILDDSVEASITSGLQPSTSYKVWLRAKCDDSTFGSWFGPVYFTTTCVATSGISEKFDGDTMDLPFCFSLVGTGGSASVSAIAGASPPNVYNALKIVGNTNSKAIVTLPPVINYNSATHQLRVVLSGSVVNAKVEIGYLKLATDPTTFVSLNRFLNIDSNSAFSTKIVELGNEPASQVLAFRYAGTSTANSNVWIDELYWEPLPICPAITAVKSTSITTTAIGLTWKMGGSEAQWEYAFGDSEATLEAKDFTVEPEVNDVNVTATLGGLMPSTNYKVWIRSKCTSTLKGAWYPYEFKTPCEMVSTFNEKFEASANIPDCLRKSGDPGIVAVGTSTAATNATNVLKLTANATGNPVVVMQPVNSNGVETYRLRFKFSSNVAGASIEVGYMTNIADPTTFNLQQSFIATAKDVIYTRSVSGDKFATQFLAFRNTGKNSTVSVDDVNWELIPACSDVDAATLAVLKSTSVQLNWHVGESETAWQYAVGTSSQNDPDALTGVDFVSPVVTDGNVISGIATGLLPSTSYKVWIRAKCGDNSFGPYSAATVFVTPCPAVQTITEDFESSTELPSCWNKLSGYHQIEANPNTSIGKNSLQLYLNPGATAIVVAMPPVSNLSAGTHRLKFKVKAAAAYANVALEIGYLTNPSDANSFVLFRKIIPSGTAYTNQVVDFGTTPTSEVIAFRNAGPYGSVVTYNIDDVIWEKIPTCPAVKNLVSTSSGSNTAGFKWTAGGFSETGWQYVKADASVKSPPSTDIVDVPLATTEVTLDNLASFTTYNIWVRSKCDESTVGDWVGPLAITTVCNASTAIQEDFESTATGALPACWKKVGDAGDASVTLGLNGSAPSGVHIMSLKTPTVDKVVVAMTPLTNLAETNRLLKFKYKAAFVGATIEVGYLTNISDAASFVSIKSYTCTTAYKTEKLTLDGNPASAVLAFRKAGVKQMYTSPQPVYNEDGSQKLDANGNQIYTPAEPIWLDPPTNTIPKVQDNTVYIDDVSWEEKTAPECAAATAVTDPNCGNFNSSISWAAVDNANGYKLTIGTASGLSDVVNNMDLGPALTYTFKGKANQKYYYTVLPYNTTGTSAGCSESTFTTNANSCYCPSVPTTKYGEGISNVKINATNIAVPNATYSDLTAQPVKIGKGIDANMHITSKTEAWSYHTNIWIDYNDNYILESGELVVSDKPTQATTPNTLDVSFNVKPTAPIGIHRMRIVSTLNKPAVANACFNEGNAVTVDLAVEIFASAAGDDPLFPVMLTVGTDFPEHSVIGTNADATAAPHNLQPGCGNYIGADVWYQADVPETGNLTFEIKSVDGDLTNIGAAAYIYIYGDEPKLQLLTCYDSLTGEGTNGLPKISFTGRDDAEPILLRVWNNDGLATGSFEVSAYDPALALLGTDVFNADKFSFYPNPVKDILNISLDQEISDVVVLNMLGQQLISKSVNANASQIDMSGLSKGTYLVKITAGNQVKTIKAVKE